MLITKHKKDSRKEVNVICNKGGSIEKEVKLNLNHHKIDKNALWKLTRKFKHKVIKGLQAHSNQLT
ncbi:unnamed protein product [Eretmochelys imbricata]